MCEINLSMFGFSPNFGLIFKQRCANIQFVTHFRKEKCRKFRISLNTPFLAPNNLILKGVLWPFFSILKKNFQKGWVKIVHSTIALYFGTIFRKTGSK
jgi:hypothetical protein